MCRNPHKNVIINPPSGPFPVTCLHLVLRVSRFVRSLDFWQTFIAFLSTFHDFPMASAARRRSKKPPALPSGFNLTFLCFGQLEMPNKQNKLIQMRPPSAMMKRHVQDLSASLPFSQTVANKALTFDFLHSKSSNQNWRLRNLSSKLKSRPTPRHHSSNLNLCPRCQQSAKMQTPVSPWDSLILMLE